MTEFYLAEQWLPVVGFEGLYEVSDQGRVRSVDRIIQIKNHPKQKERLLRGKILYQKINRPAGHGYERSHVALWKENEEYTKKVARLVAEAFLPNPNNFPFVLHLNDDATDNRASNLEWGDHLENVRQAVERNRYPLAEMHHNYVHGRYAKNR